jgi:hypothetical protein
LKKRVLGRIEDGGGVDDSFYFSFFLSGGIEGGGMGEAESQVGLKG